jgi:hypothetical protein
MTFSRNGSFSSESARQHTSSEDRTYAMPSIPFQRWPATAALLVFALFILVGCDSTIFDAEDPGSITEDGLNTPAALNALVTGVMGNYNNAYDNVVFYTGVGSDELLGGDTSEPINAASRRGEYLNFAGAGSRLVPVNLWNPLQAARFLAEETFPRLLEHLPDAESDPRTAIVRLYGGMTYLNIAEIFCEAAYDGGPAVTREDSYQIAKDRLAEAIQLGMQAGADSVVEMAHLQRARARLAMGDGAGALSDARAVSDGFSWRAVYRSASGEENAVYNLQNVNGFAVVHEGYRELDDPRVPVVRGEGNTPDGQVPRWNQMKYPDRAADMPIGTWQEARLIEAEVLMDGGEFEPALTLLNQVREASGLEPLSTDLTGEAAIEAMRTERKHELFLTNAHRLVDMRRWDLFEDGWEDCVPIPYTEVQDNENL